MGEVFFSKKRSGKNLLSHRDIANRTNPSRQTVWNTLSVLRKAVTLDYNTEHITVPEQLVLAD